MDDFGKAKSVHMIRWPVIRDQITNLCASSYYGGLYQRDEIHSDIVTVSNMVRDWLGNVIDLSPFQFSYPVNGIHNSIEQWLSTETRPIYCFRGEYPYAMSLTDRITVVDDVVEIPNGSVVYMSNPFSSTGMYDNRYYNITAPVILDLAYVGTTASFKIDITPNTEQVFWSGSKCFGLSCFRMGYRFTKKPEPMQEILKTVGYTNWQGVNILKLALESYGPFDTHALVKPHYDSIIMRNSLVASDSYLLGLSKDKKHEIFAREDGVFRVPVGRILDKIVQTLDIR
jgi:hypothetical protein